MAAGVPRFRANQPSTKQAPPDRVQHGSYSGCGTACAAQSAATRLTGRVRRVRGGD
ncbi:unnamed protein product [Symbiodinium microadriaticum]|nr:unnamed protein product [Symbiodinium microadriaticum]